MNGDVMNMLSSIMQDPKAMEKAMSMANMLASSGILEGMQSQNEEPKETKDTGAPNNIQSSLPQKSGSEHGQNAKGQVSMNDRLALLCAIRPYLKEDKAEKLDSVIRILKIVGTLENSGIKLF